MKSSLEPTAGMLDAQEFARTRLSDVAPGEHTLHEYSLDPSPNMFDDIFQLQQDVEALGPMDYRAYSQLVWNRFTGNAPQDSDGFAQFKSELIVGLHGIDMKPLVYPNVIESMVQLADLYKDRIKSVAIWSTGDVDATGYQVAKIASARILQSFLGKLRQSIPLKDERRKFVTEKTTYIVDGKKHERLVEYVGAQLEKQTDEEPLKVVIIEDSSSSFEKAQKLLDEKFGTGKVTIFPVWFVGSREGIQAQAQVDNLVQTGDEVEHQTAKKELEDKKTRLNAIDSFDQLLEERFAEMFDGAHVMVDFDGVICDNIAMRVQQARVIYGSLLRGISRDTGEDVESIHNRLQQLQ